MGSGGVSRGGGGGGGKSAKTCTHPHHAHHHHHQPSPKRKERQDIAIQTTSIERPLAAVPAEVVMVTGERQSPFSSLQEMEEVRELPEEEEGAGEQSQLTKVMWIIVGSILIGCVVLLIVAIVWKFLQT